MGTTGAVYIGRATPPVSGTGGDRISPMHEALEDVRDRVAFQHAHQQPMRCVAAVVGQEARRDVAATDVAVDHGAGCARWLTPVNLLDVGHAYRGGSPAVPGFADDDFGHRAVGMTG